MKDKAATTIIQRITIDNAEKIYKDFIENNPVYECILLKESESSKESESLYEIQNKNDINISGIKHLLENGVKSLYVIRKKFSVCIAGNNYIVEFRKKTSRSYDSAIFEEVIPLLIEKNEFQLNTTKIEEEIEAAINEDPKRSIREIVGNKFGLKTINNELDIPNLSREAILSYRPKEGKSEKEKNAIQSETDVRLNPQSTGNENEPKFKNLPLTYNFIIDALLILILGVICCMIIQKPNIQNTNTGTIIYDGSTNISSKEIKQPEDKQRTSEPKKASEDAKRLEEEKKAAEAKTAAEDATRLEEERKAAEAKTAAEDATRLEEERKAAEAKKAAEEAKRLEEERKAAEAKKAAEEAKRLEEERKAAEGKKAAEAKKAAEEAIRLEEEHKVAEAKKAEEAKHVEEMRKIAAESAKRFEDGRKAEDVKTATEEERRFSGVKNAASLVNTPQPAVVVSTPLPAVAAPQPAVNALQSVQQTMGVGFQSVPKNKFKVTIHVKDLGQSRETIMEYCEENPRITLSTPNTIRDKSRSPYVFYYLESDNTNLGMLKDQEESNIKKYARDSKKILNFGGISIEKID